MKILVCTQAVDLDDPVLGFFHSWLQELAKRCEHIDVICLKEGKHNLPNNVSVYSLGKPSFVKTTEGEGNRALLRIKYVWNFYRYIWILRNECDSVFVHMNQEYVLLSGFFWKIFGKKVVLWRNHKMGSILTRVAGLLSHKVCYTSPAAFVSAFGNAVKMPIGIDTELFAQRRNAEPNSILFLGRIDPVKKPEIFVEAVSILKKDGIKFCADIYGDPTYQNHALRKLKKDAEPLIASGVLSFRKSVPNAQTPAIYASHEVYVNLTPSGSFDKTIGEAMASGCIVVVANGALRDILPKEFIIKPEPAPVASALKYALALLPEKKVVIQRRGREYIEREHSLALLAERLFELYQNT